MRLLAGLCLLFGLAATSHAATLTGVVIVVIDGDTVLFKPDHYRAASRSFLRIRLADIDAPENDQPHGDAASRALTMLVLNQRVEVDTVATDVYGRTIAHIRMGGVRVNADMVRRGFAWAYDSTRASSRKGTSARSGSDSVGASTRQRDRSALMDAQREARRAQRGLWEDAAPTPPWVWRRAQSIRVE